MQGRVRVMRREAVVLNEESHSRPNNQMEMRGGLRNHVARTKAVNESKIVGTHQLVPQRIRSRGWRGLAAGRHLLWRSWCREMMPW